MKIIKFTAENFQKIRAIEIIPDPDNPIVEITGRNAMGKTAVLNSITATLQGGAAIPEEPIRQGAEKGKTTLEIGDLTILRTYTHKGSYLTVTTKEGLKANQTFLNTLVGKYSFDPLAFSRLDEKAQRDVLLSVVDIPLDEKHLANIAQVEIPPHADPLQRLNVVYKIIYDNRTALNQKVKELQGSFDLITVLPEEENTIYQSAADLLLERSRYARANAERESIGNQIGNMKEHLGVIALEKQELEMKLSALAIRQEELTAKHTEALDQYHHMPEHDLTEIDARATTIDANNLIAAKVERKKTTGKELKAKQAEAHLLTVRLQAIMGYKEQLMMKTIFPVKGLDFGAGKVLYQGVPFSQASAAEKLRVSMGIAMALNPKIRVIRIEDGSLLDSTSMKIIYDMAKDKDYQIWVETVSEKPEGHGWFIVDGAIITADNDDSPNQEQEESPPLPDEVPAEEIDPESYEYFPEDETGAGPDAQEKQTLRRINNG